MENDNSRFVEKQNPRILVLWDSRIQEFPFCGNENPRILVLWKMRNGEFWFSGFLVFFSGFLVFWFSGFFSLVFWFFFFPQNENSRIFGFSDLWESKIREFSFRWTRQSEDSRFVENKNPRNLV